MKVASTQLWFYWALLSALFASLRWLTIYVAMLRLRLDLG